MLRLLETKQNTLLKNESFFSSEGFFAIHVPPVSHIN